MSSFRIAKTEDASPPVATGKFSIARIDKGTIVNATHMKFTFVCQGCIDGRLGFAAGGTMGTFEMGWALADTADSDTTLLLHNSGECPPNFESA